MNFESSLLRLVLRKDQAESAMFRFAGGSLRSVLQFLGPKIVSAHVSPKTYVFGALRSYGSGSLNDSLRMQQQQTAQQMIQYSLGLARSQNSGFIPLFVYLRQYSNVIKLNGNAYLETVYLS